MLSTWYFWQQRFDALTTTPDSPWFDNPATKDKRETLTDVIRAAAPRARASIEAVQGKDPAGWSWGKAHTLRFRQSRCGASGAGQELVGGFTVQRSGQRRDAQPRRVRLPEAVRCEFLPDSMRMVVGLRGSGQDRGGGRRRGERAPFPAAPERSGPHPRGGRAPAMVVRAEAKVEANAKSHTDAVAVSLLPECGSSPGSHRHGGDTAARPGAGAGIHGWGCSFMPRRGPR
jgi:hypothetical protein